MHRFFVDDNAIEGEVVKVTGSDFNHISHSLRMEPGDIFIVNTGDGIDYTAEIIKIEDKLLRAKIIDSKRNMNEPDLDVTIAQGIPKNNNMDLIVQKCTEIGIKKIIPLNTERTIVKLSGKKLQRRLDRWQKIAEEAAKQSRRGIIPQVDRLRNMKELSEIFTEYDLILIPWEDEEKNGLKDIWSAFQEKSNPNPEKVLIIIGPEGGFSEEEVRLVRQNGGEAITLGPRILRTETAGFVALTAVMYQAGELGG